AATAAKSRRLSLSSFPAIAGKGDRAVRGGRGAGLAEFSFNEDETSSQKPPPPPCVRYAHYGRSPSPLSRGRKASASVLAVRFSSRPSHRHAISKNDAANRPSSDAPGSGTAGCITIGDGAR